MDTREQITSTCKSITLCAVRKLEIVANTHLPRVEIQFVGPPLSVLFPFSLTYSLTLTLTFFLTLAKHF